MAEPTPKKTQRASHLQWVPISEMKVSPRAQQEYKQSHAEMLAADFDLEAIGYPVVNHRGGHYYVVDGQHRIGALKLIGYGDQQIQCECYKDLTEAEEAEEFLRRNTRKQPPVFEKFRIAITAGREIECDIDRTVRTQGLVISKDQIPGAVRAVGTLRRVYTRSGPAILGRTLRIIRDAYGDAGFSAPVIDGIGLLCQRYNGELPPEKDVVASLSKINGGVHGLLNAAEVMRKKTGNQKSQCVAGAAVDYINRGRSGAQRLAPWWS